METLVQTLNNITDLCDYMNIRYEYVSVTDYDCSLDFFWTGNYLPILKLDQDNINYDIFSKIARLIRRTIHEIAHWIVATPQERLQHNFGLINSYEIETIVYVISTSIEDLVLAYSFYE